MEDGIENILYNPAAMNSLGVGDKSIYLTLNPIGAVAAVANLEDLSARERRKGSFWLGLGGVFFKSLSLSNQTFQLSFLMSEDLRAASFDKKINDNLNTNGLLDLNYHAAALRISLARQVSIGASAFYFNHYKDGKRDAPSFGSSYGIMMKPSSQLYAGISYFYFPDHVDSLMLEAYGLKKNTVNAGITYSPIYKVKLALDIRNISGDDSASPDQIHAGIEVLPSYRLALRAGFCGKTGDGQNVSFGFGVGDFRPFRTESDFVFSNILLNYGLVAEINDYNHLKHSLTFLIRF